MNVRAYLKRIGFGYTGHARPSIEVLRKLHRRHLLAIPFENLDIHLGRRIILSEAAFYDKIVNHCRGGFCYELNGSFAILLKRLGFRVSMLSARVARKDGGFTPGFDHMTLLVRLRECWLADVGFGESFTEPKRIDTSNPQSDDRKIYRIIRIGRERLVSRFDEKKDSWESQYAFTLRSRKLEDFVPRCRYHQSSPDSHFKKGRLITRLSSTGRVTLTDKKFIMTNGSKRVERPVRNRKEFNALLRRRFGMDLR